MSKKLTLAVITAGALIGASTLAFAQAGTSSQPEPSTNGPAVTQPGTSGTTGSGTQEFAPAGPSSVPQPAPDASAAPTHKPTPDPVLPRR
jgi:hypothetical protein